MQEGGNFCLLLAHLPRGSALPSPSVQVLAFVSSEKQQFSIWNICSASSLSSHSAQFQPAVNGVWRQEVFLVFSQILLKRQCPLFEESAGEGIRAQGDSSHYSMEMAYGRKDCSYSCNGHEPKGIFRNTFPRANKNKWYICFKNWRKQSEAKKVWYLQAGPALRRVCCLIGQVKQDTIRANMVS